MLNGEDDAWRFIGAFGWVVFVDLVAVVEYGAAQWAALRALPLAEGYHHGRWHALLSPAVRLERVLPLSVLEGVKARIEFLFDLFDR